VISVRELIDRYGGKALRYSSVSFVGIVLTQALLVLFYKGIGWDAWVSNFVAVMISTFPVYLLNRAWVWHKHDAHSLTREVLPFWGMSLLGLVLSTVGVGIVSKYTDSALAASATSVASFGVLWVGKFILLEKVLFKGEHVTLIDAEPFVAADPSEER
jgi:putative flippase GtrA